MLDIRLPIGWLFAIVGAMLAIYGVVQPVSTQMGTLSVNLNATWGSVMTVFGVGMLLLTRERK